MIWKDFMDSRIKEAIFRQVKKEPFAKKIDLKLVDLDELMNLLFVDVFS